MIEISRRQCLSFFSGVVAESLPLSNFATAHLGGATFPIPVGTVYLNGARLHPLSQESLSDIHSYLDHRALNPVADLAYFGELEDEVKQAFGTLINSPLENISYIQSTQIAENLIIAGLGIDQKTHNIVTEGLHYRGSIYLYGELAKQGFDVRVVPPRENQTRIEDLISAIDERTKLVSISLVSYINGFQHDLKAVCDAAHAKGALVYADIVQAAGSVPTDVQASGVDFCACSAYKWLMGERGLGFLYVKKGLLGSTLKQTQFGSDELASYDDHLFSTDPPIGGSPSWTQRPGAAGYFQVGTGADVVAASLRAPLKFLNKRGVGRLQAERRPLMERLMREVPKLGFPCITPTPDTPIVSFAVTDRAALENRLKRRNVWVSFIEHTMRVSPSIFNSNADIDRLLESLKP